MLSHFDITRAQQRQTESCSRRRVYAHRTIKKSMYTHDWYLRHGRALKHWQFVQRRLQVI